jgi:hypothetical protein
MNVWLSGSFLANIHSIQIHSKFEKNDQTNMVVNFKDFDIVIFITKCSPTYGTF